MNRILLDNNEIFPSKVVCIGRNYMDHIAELNNEVPEDMVFFIKPNSSISDKLIFPKNQNSCHYEAEISFLIEDNKITAVGFGLDLTLREVQSKLKEKGLPWERAKAFDGASVFSKFVSFIDDITKLEIELFINGELKQKGDYSLMINKPSEIISEANSFLTFEDGDILMSGTPKGVGSFNIGDVFVGKILYDGKVLIEETFTVN
jgi:2-keto-4-pentenoate hydratase/2-oxohepta-3-ene-1,7-dioic acid hydratase in catechol pathway